MKVRLLLVVAGLLCAALAGEPVREAPLRVLQMNLCNSGMAGCYTGRSVAEAAALIRMRQPDVVTLNEICRSDVDVLARSFPAGTVRTAFQPAIDRRTLAPITCRAGDSYGIGLLTRSPSGGAKPVGGVYPAQDVANAEERAWLCAPAARGVVACTTHLTATSPAVAEAQCRFLFAWLPALIRGTVVVGGDFNLGGLESCLPPHYVSVSDGGLQFVVAAAAVGSVRSRLLGLAGSTDHPALLVSLG
jgi:hypothetical protein